MDENNLIYLSKSNDQQAFNILVFNYKKFIRHIANSFFIVGTEKEDILQEALIGFYKAVRDYNFELKKSFIAFAEMCIRRHIITAIKTALREKHKIHLNSVSLNKPIFIDNTTKNLLDIIPDDRIMCPEATLLHEEEISIFREVTTNILSDLEFKALFMFYNGLSYNDIAEKLGKNYKSIDASINRAKIKLRKHLEIE